MVAPKGPISGEYFRLWSATPGKELLNEKLRKKCPAQRDQRALNDFTAFPFLSIIQLQIHGTVIFFTYYTRAY